MKACITQILRPALSLFLLLSIITGLIYPGAIAAVANLAFAQAAAGSLVTAGGHLAGSRLIGQNFADPGHFWGRPSATAPQAYNGTASGGSNLGPSNPALTDAVRARVAALQAADPGNAALVPLDLVTASASGLDPDISPAAAHYQAGRIARIRGISLTEIDALVDRHIQPRQWGLLGEARVNVLALNLDLDNLACQRSQCPRVNE